MTALERDQLIQLHQPFPAADVEWRIQQSGEKDGKIWARVLAYITNRAIQQRLDDVCGPENWYNIYRREKTDDGKTAVLCGIAVRVAREDGNAEWVIKWDGAEETDVESVKGGLSSSMKRAAVQWGSGRYLYDLTAGYAVVHDKGKNFAKSKEGTFKWDPPALPGWALPAPKKAKASESVETYLATIRESFRRIPDDYTTMVEGNMTNLKAWLLDKANAEKMRENPALAKTMADLCQQVE